MKIQTDSQTPRIGIHLDSEIIGAWDSNVINTFALGSAVCVQPLHADLFPNPHYKEKATINNSWVYISVQEINWTGKESFCF